MIDPQWISLLIQIPIVGVFVWYSLEMHKRIQTITDNYIASLERHDAAVNKRVDAMIEADRQIMQNLITELKIESRTQTSDLKQVDKDLSSEMQQHDKYVREKVATKHEETPPFSPTVSSRSPRKKREE